MGLAGVTAGGVGAHKDAYVWTAGDLSLRILVVPQNLRRRIPVHVALQDLRRAVMCFHGERRVPKLRAVWGNSILTPPGSVSAKMNLRRLRRWKRAGEEKKCYFLTAAARLFQRGLFRDRVSATLALYILYRYPDCSFNALVRYRLYGKTKFSPGMVWESARAKHAALYFIPLRNCIFRPSSRWNGIIFFNAKRTLEFLLARIMITKFQNRNENLCSNLARDSS